MEIIIRILAALGIVFLTGLVIGILWGLYWAEREERKKQKRKAKIIQAMKFIRENAEDMWEKREK